MADRIQYMDRTRAYYAAQGFTRPYQWAHDDDIPFFRPDKALRDSTVAIVTTAIHPKDQHIPMVGRTARSWALDDVPETFFTDDLSWDKVTTHTEDRESYFPLEYLRRLQAEQVIGQCAPRYHFVPTEYSQRQTLGADAPQVLAACREDAVDVALLVPL
jgi:hypothetical protein